MALNEGEGREEFSRGLPKANILHRFIAKFLDLLIVAASVKTIPPVGFFIGLAYLLIADGLWQGQSVGKRIVGLYTVRMADQGAGSFKESILRNVPLAAGLILGEIPYLGWILMAAVLVLESLLIIGNDRGLRIGDEVAQTQVIDRLPIPQTTG